MQQADVAMRMHGPPIKKDHIGALCDSVARHAAVICSVTACSRASMLLLQAPHNTPDSMTEHVMQHGHTAIAQSLPGPVDMDRPSHPLESPSPTEKQIKSLDDEITSGQYGDVGSTKARLAKPLRKLLAQTPGPGALKPHALHLNGHS